MGAGIDRDERVVLEPEAAFAGERRDRKAARHPRPEGLGDG